jgi:hypothetical protein
MHGHVWTNDIYVPYKIALTSVKLAGMKKYESTEA